MQTLVIASSASMAAALVTSRLFPPGAVFTAALTPVIVAMVSEMLHRPVNRVTEIREARRTTSREGELLRSARTGRDVPAQGGAWVEPLGDDSDPFNLRAADERPSGNGSGAGHVNVQGGRRRFGRIHPRVAIATGLLAFVIGAAVLTLPELIFGGAVATGKRTTLVPVGSAKSEPKKAEQPKQKTETAPQQTGTETAPAQETPQSTTETTPQDTTPTETDPSGGTPAPVAPPAGTTPSQTPPSG
jgi:hypothetical protein